MNNFHSIYEEETRDVCRHYVPLSGTYTTDLSKVSHEHPTCHVTVQIVLHSNYTSFTMLQKWVLQNLNIQPGNSWLKRWVNGCVRANIHHKAKCYKTCEILAKRRKASQNQRQPLKMYAHDAVHVLLRQQRPETLVREASSITLP